MSASVYAEQDIAKATQKFLVRIQTTAVRSDDICRDTAKLLADQKVIGWFQGGSEFGPRALGNRSLLADPRKAEMKDILNSRVKHRQPFRPFAPIVLAERVKEIFEGEEDLPFMLIAKAGPPGMARPDSGDRPCRRHGAGADRARGNQSVLYRLLKEFEALTGVPVLINTSFNVKGEPIVETPRDAMICFLTTGIDNLVLHDTLVSKNALHQVVGPLVEHLHRRRQHGGVGDAAGLTGRGAWSARGDAVHTDVRQRPRHSGALVRKPWPPPAWAAACPAFSTRRCNRRPAS